MIPGIGHADGTACSDRYDGRHVGGVSRADHHRLHHRPHWRGRSENATSPAGFQAELDRLQERRRPTWTERKLVPLIIDDQTSPTEIVTAVERHLQMGAPGSSRRAP